MTSDLSASFLLGACLQREALLGFRGCALSVAAVDKGGPQGTIELAAGASDPASTTVSIPTGIAPGTYYLGAIADYPGGVPESDETNNGLAGNTITVTR